MPASRPAAGRARNTAWVDPSRKRRIRFVVALSAAVVLASALIYTSFSASSEARTPSQLLRAAQPGRIYQLTGKVVAGYRHAGETTYFQVRDRTGRESVPVRYTGVLPDPFRADREIVVDVRKEGDTFVGQKDSLVTKCPSKFSAEQTKT
jgi:cytochrome c-type biogenesis protein CcmE